MSNDELTVTQPETTVRKPSLSLNKETLRQLKARTWLDDVVGGVASATSTAPGVFLNQHGSAVSLSVSAVFR